MPEINIIKTYKIGDQIQRQLLTMFENGTLYRRIRCTVTPQGDLDKKLEEPWWQYKSEIDGEWVNETLPDTVEWAFQTYCLDTEA